MKNPVTDMFVGWLFIVIVCIFLCKTAQRQSKKEELKGAKKILSSFIRGGFPLVLSLIQGNHWKFVKFVL